MKPNTIGRLFCSAVLLAATASAGQAQVELIENGGFDIPDLINPPPGYETINDPPEGFGWTVVSDGTPHPAATTGITGVDVIDGFWTCIGGTDNPDGRGQCLDVDGKSSISQSFPTVRDQRYFVEFNYSHHFQSGSSTGFLTVQGVAELISETLVHNLPNNRLNMNWLLFTDTFVADSAETTLTIMGLAAQGGLGFVVDNFSVVALDGGVQPDPVIAKTLSFGPRQLDGGALVEVPGTAPGQIKLDHDQAQFFGFTIDVGKADSASPDGFVLSDGLAPFVVLSADGEAAADDPGGAMMIGGSCDDGLCDGIKLEADPPTAACTAEARLPGRVDAGLDVELAAGTVVTVRLGSDSAPFEVGDACRVSLFVETVEARRRGGDDDDDEDDDDGFGSGRFEPDALLELLDSGGVATNEWFTLNSGVKLYDPRDGNLIRGPVEGLALQPVP